MTVRAPRNVDCPGRHRPRSGVQHRHAEGRTRAPAGSRHRASTARADDVARAAQQSADPAAMRLRAHRTGMHRPTSTCSGAASASAMGGILLQNSPRSAEVAQPSRKRSCCPIASLAQWSPLQRYRCVAANRRFGPITGIPSYRIRRIARVTGAQRTRSTIGSHLRKRYRCYPSAHAAASSCPAS